MAKQALYSIQAQQNMDFPFPALRDFPEFLPFRLLIRPRTLVDSPSRLCPTKATTTSPIHSISNYCSISDTTLEQFRLRFVLCFYNPISIPILRLSCSYGPTEGQLQSV